MTTGTDYGGLVERLHDMHERVQGFNRANGERAALVEAADAITALQAERDEARANYQLAHERAAEAMRASTATALKARVEELEAAPAAYTAEQVQHSLETQAASLRALPKNWDGYGADPVKPEAIAMLIGEIESDGFLVNICPGSDGSIQAEWHLGSVSIEYDISADGKRSLYVENRRAPVASLPQGVDNG